MRRFVTVLVVAFGLVGLLGAPAGAQVGPVDPPYPPVPGADCAAVGIQTVSPWTVNSFNSVVLQVQNLGDTPARCVVFLSVHPGAQIQPGALRVVVLGPGESAFLSYQVSPSQPSSHTVTGCAWSVFPFDSNLGNSCTSTTVEAVGPQPSPRFSLLRFLFGIFGG